jgi:hypothetical protein
MPKLFAMKWGRLRLSVASPPSPLPVLAIDPLPLACKVGRQRFGEHVVTVIGRTWPDGIVCRRCPAGECDVAGGWCQVVVPDNIPTPQCPTFSLADWRRENGVLTRTLARFMFGPDAPPTIPLPPPPTISARIPIVGGNITIDLPPDGQWLEIQAFDAPTFRDLAGAVTRPLTGGRTLVVRSFASA